MDAKAITAIAEVERLADRLSQVKVKVCRVTGCLGAVAATGVDHCSLAQIRASLVTDQPPCTLFAPLRSTSESLSHCSASGA